MSSKNPKKDINNCNDMSEIDNAKMFKNKEVYNNNSAHLERLRRSYSKYSKSKSAIVIWNELLY